MVGRVTKNGTQIKVRLFNDKIYSRRSKSTIKITTWVWVKKGWKLCLNRKYFSCILQLSIWRNWCTSILIHTVVHKGSVMAHVSLMLYGSCMLQVYFPLFYMCNFQNAGVLHSVMCLNASSVDTQRTLCCCCANMLLTLHLQCRHR